MATFSSGERSPNQEPPDEIRRVGIPSSEENKSAPIPSSSKFPQEGAKLMENDKFMGMKAMHRLEEQKLKDHGGQISEYCLGIPTILRRILEQISDKELIGLSLVNKSWNFEARSVLRDRGCVRAKVISTSACLERFASDLEKMRVVPFTGIRFRIDDYGYDAYIDEELPSASLNPSYQVILDRLPWKHVSAVIACDLWDFTHGPSFLLFKRILEDNCGVLEELSFDYCKSIVTEFFETVFQNRSFPCLKILKFNGPAFSFHQQGRRSPFSSAFVRALVSSAPSLEKLCLNGAINFKENVMEGSSAVLLATYGLHPLSEQVCENLIDALRTEFINVFRATSESFDVELLNRFVPMVIQASHTMLTTFWMDLLFAVPLMCYGICLENVTRLGICATYSTVEDLQPNILALVSSFDFTRVFPKLDRVKIRDYDYTPFSSDDISGFIERGNVVAARALPDRAVNVKHLELDYDGVNSSTPPLIFLAQLFPHVTTLSVRTKDLQEFPFTLLWEHFGCLTELHVDFDGYHAPITTNLDSVFCGILPEEVAELRTKDDDYLKAVNIVPVMPSIRSMRGLRLLTLQYTAGYVHRNRQVPTRVFSKVTGLVGFRRCPDLSVKFTTTYNSPEALDHMKPYVTVNNEPRLTIRDSW